MQKVYNSAGGRERRIFGLKVSSSGVVSGMAFDGSVNLNRVDTKACPVDVTTKIIVVPC